MKNLFNEFEGVSREEWLNQIEKDLKGKPLTVLSSKPEPDLEIIAYHHKEDSPTKKGVINRPLSKNKNDWNIRMTFDNQFDTNQSVLEALNEGVNSIGLTLSEGGVSYESLTKEIGFEHISSDIQFKTKELALATQPSSYSNLNFDVIGMNALAGKDIYTLEDYYAFFQKHKNNKTIWVTGSAFGAAGSSTLQELGMTLAALNEYIQFLVDKGESLSTINDKIIVELSVNENYFVNMAKFRVFRNLVDLLFKGYDANYQVKPILVYAKTNARHYSNNDSNNNPLRQTTQAMSAVIGGCDTLTIAYRRSSSEETTKRSARIAKNIQLVLKEEAYLDKVVDPVGGSYYIESLSTQIIEKSWNLFLEIETAGGLIESLKKGILQTKIEENKKELIADLNSGKRMFLGVNKYPNPTEDWIVCTPPTERAIEFQPLSEFRLEAHYEKITAEHE